MPEVPKRINAAVAQAKNLLPSGDDFIGDYDVRHSQFDQQGKKEVITNAGIVAHGAEQMAFAHPTNPNRLQFVSYVDMEPNRAKLVYYTHKVLHTLFPYNFPRIHASFGMKTGFTSGTVREKVVRDSQVKKLNNPLKKAFDTLEELGFKPVVEYSKLDAHNVIVSTEGEYFVEVITKTLRDFDPVKVMQYMRSRKFSFRDIETVQKALQKIAGIREKIGNDKLDVVEATRMIALGLVKPQDPEYDAMVKRSLDGL